MALTLDVLNAYAGIGGNRHLWPGHWSVTAVEHCPKTAAEYARRYPNDRVIVDDAHAFVLRFAGEFAGVWSSPPCPTHSRLARVVASRHGTELRPDPRLAVEIEHLSALPGGYVVENVHSYYRPVRLPDVVTDRHYYWASAVPVSLVTKAGLPALDGSTTSDQLADAYGLPRVPARAVPDRRLAMRNAVHPVEGLEMALAAFGRGS